jgi:serine protease
MQVSKLKKIITASLAVASIAVSSSILADTNTVLDGKQQFIVKFKESATSKFTGKSKEGFKESMLEYALAKKVTFLKQTAFESDVFVIEDAEASEMQSMLDKISQMSDVLYVEEDKLMQHMLQPNDTRYGEQGHYFDQGTSINAEPAWDKATGQGVVVAVLDTGYRPHADLNDNILPGYDMISGTDISNDGDGRDSDAKDPGDWTENDQCGLGRAGRNSSWHGTHVSGTIAAETNNNRDVAGVAFNAKIVPVRVLGMCGGRTSDIADGIVWAAGGGVSGVPRNQNPAQVINLSLGGGGSCSQTYINAINSARSNGATVVVAAGNSDRNASNAVPANCPGVLTVAATGPTGNKASYSNFGSVVDVAAPGGDIRLFGLSGGVLSTLNSGTRGPASDSLEFFQGTSMATPHVAGIAALLYEVKPDATPDEIEAAIVNSAQLFPGSCSQCGSGIADASAAIDAISPTPNAPNAVSARVNNGDDITITWSSVTNAQIYQREVSINSGNYRNSKSYNAPQTSVIFSNQRPRSYRYRVRACNRINSCSPWTVSNKVTVEDLSPPKAPSSVSATIANGNDITISWSSVDDAETYQRQVSINSGSYINLKTYNAPQTSVTFNNQRPRSYRYRVRACARNNSVCSSWKVSNSVTVN